MLGYTSGGRQIIEMGSMEQISKILYQQIAKYIPDLKFKLVRVYNSGYDAVAVITIQGIQQEMLDINQILNIDQSEFCHQFFALTKGHSLKIDWSQRKDMPKEVTYQIFVKQYVSDQQTAATR